MLPLNWPKRRHGFNLGVLGGTSGGSFYNSMSDRSDMTFGEKSRHVYYDWWSRSFVIRLFSAADVALTTGRKSVFQQTVRTLKQQSKDRLSQLTRRRAAAEGFKIAGKQGGEEFLEEFTIGLLQEALPYVDDMAFGRTPKDINWFNIIDAGIAGLIGAAPTSAMSGYSSFQAHSSVLKRKE